MPAALNRAAAEGVVNNRWIGPAMKSTGPPRTTPVNGPSSAPGRRITPGRAPTDFVEFDVPQAGRLALESFTLREATPCGTCGRWERTLDHAVLEPGTAPADADLFRATNHVTVVLASERFVDAVRSLGLTGLRFVPADGIAQDT